MEINRPPGAACPDFMLCGAPRESISIIQEVVTLQEGIVVAGILATASTAMRSGFQGLRIARAKTAAGVSESTWALGLGSALVWFAWAARYLEPANLVANFLTTLGCLIVFIEIARYRGAKVWVWAAGAAGAAGLTFGADFALPGALAMCAVALSCTMVLPQLTRTLRSSDISAISGNAWAASIFSATMWTTYGAGIKSWTILAPNFVIIPAAVAILSKKALAARGAGLVPSGRGFVSSGHRNGLTNEMRGVAELTTAASECAVTGCNGHDGRLPSRRRGRPN